MRRAVNWIVGVFVVSAVVLALASEVRAEPPIKEGDTGFVSGSFCNREGHFKIVEALLKDYKDKNANFFAQVWDKQVEEKNCNSVSEALILTISYVAYEGMTRFGKMWTVRYMVADIVEIYSGYFDQGPQPKPIDMQGTPI